MKPMMILGIVLIILGVIGLVVQGVSYATREKVVDVPGVQITAEKQKTVPIPAIAVVVLAARKSA